MEEVQPTFRAFIARTRGDEGRAWLAALPGLVAEISARWRLTLGDELHGGVLSHVCEATAADGAPAVLKLGPPWSHTADEAAALRSWSGRATPRLLRADVKRHALLLERIEPGTHAGPGEPEDVARVLAAIHVPPPRRLPALGSAVRQRLGSAGAERRASEQKLAWAHAALERLERTQPAPVLVHGDFDDRNLLVCATRGLCAIDPLPCAGDPAYDAGTWVHANRRPGRRARLDAIVAAGGLDRERVRDWAAIVGVHG
jgi:streptomycin 6-kinase